MKNIKYSGTREQILHATSVKQAQEVFGSLSGYPAQYIKRCKSALNRALERLSKETTKQEPEEWSPGQPKSPGKSRKVKA